MNRGQQGSGLTRRAVLGRAGAAAAGMAVAPVTGSAIARAASTPLQLPSLRKLWDWHEDLADAGPRLTGNRAHRAHVDFIADQLEREGLRVHRDQHRFLRWDPKRWSLRVAGTEIPTTYYFPYSGSTSPAGVTAPLAFCGTAPGDFSQAAGKIAIVDCPVPSLPASVLFDELGRYPRSSPGLEGTVSLPFAQGLLSPADLTAAKNAGVVGVICVWRGISDELAKAQLNPFSTPYQDCPAVWVGAATGDGLKFAAQQGAALTLTMEADVVDRASSDTVYAVLPGHRKDETVIVNTHTDGPNVPEENGPLGVLGLVHHFARIPRSRRRRTLVFAFVTGHFQLPQFAKDGNPFNQASSRWLADHPELWDGKGRHAKAVAGVTLEHLGCREWADDAAHTDWAATGRNENGFTYTTSERLRRIYLSAARGTANRRTEADRPSGALMVGEGAALYHAGIPGMHLAPLPSYLVRVSKDGELHKLSKRLFHGQLESFAKAMTALDRTSTDAIGALLPPAGA